MADQRTQIVISAKDETKAAFDSIGSGLDRLNSATFGATKIFTGFTAALSAASVAMSFKNFVGFAAGLDDMAERTGATVESLSALSGVAKVGGHDLGLVETGAIRLAKALAGADDEAKGAAHALETLGLDKQKLQSMDTGEALKVVADRLAEFKDGAGKTALAMDLFGKSGAQLLPFLKDLGEQGALQGKITAEQAAQAEQLEKSWKRLESQSGKLSKQIATELLPPMLSLSEVMLKLMKPGGGTEKVEITWLDNFVDTAAEKLAQFNVTLSRYRTQFYETLGLKGLAAESAKAQGDAERALASVVARRTGKPSELQELLDKNDATVAGDGKKSLKGYRSNTGTGGAAGKTGKTDLERMLERGQQNELEAYYETGGEETMRIVAEKRAMTDAQRDFAEATRQAKEEQSRLNALLAVTDTGKLEKARDDMQLLTDALQEGVIGEKEYLEAVTARLEKMNEKVKEGKSFAQEFGLTFSSAFEDAIVKGKKFGEVIQGVAQDVARMIIRKQVTEPLGNSVTSALSGVNWRGLLGMNADGGVYNSPSLSRYSNGVYDSPRLFAFANGMGIFAEAGPEAIMPLSRGRDGKLGVRAEGGGMAAPNVVIQMENRTGTDATMRQNGPARMDGDQWVIGVVMERAQTDPGFRAMLRGG